MRSTSLAGVAVPTVMIVWPPQIALLISGTVMTSSSREIGPGRPTFAVVNWHQMSLASGLSVNETPIWLPLPTSGATLPCSSRRR